MINEISRKRSGSYYTKPEIVSLILDLVGYTTDKPLYSYSLLEPATGDGAFLKQIIERLLCSAAIHYGDSFINNEFLALSTLSNCIKAVEFDSTKFVILNTTVRKLLRESGASQTLSQKLANEWIIKDDFLLWNKPVNQKFHFIVGNPPYVRIENMDNELLKYRSLYSTLFDRADIYVAFIEHSLEMLSENGKLSFICTDRFTKNQYGKKIRELINNNYRVLHYLDIHNTQPFEDNVSAYPCIFTIENAPRGEGMTIKMDKISDIYLKLSREYLLAKKEPNIEDIKIYTINEWFSGTDPWILNGERARFILSKLENENPLITEEPNFIHVGIGVATGATDIYLIDPKKVDVEADVLLPVVTKDDIAKGFIDWRGHYVISPYLEDGSLIDLDKYPKLLRYFLEHEERLKSRRTAKDSPSKWYKTIDRIFPERLKQPKLLIPDIKAKTLIVKDDGEYYPEHSLYYITAGSWDVEALQAIMVSSVIKFFIWSYATKMRGDYLRYQAQYLRKIRLPLNVSKQDTTSLINLYKEGKYAEIDILAMRLYNLSDEEMQDIIDLVE